MQQCVNHPIIVSPNRGFWEFALIEYVLPFSAPFTHACGEWPGLTQQLVVLTGTGDLHHLVTYSQQEVTS